MTSDQEKLALVLLEQAAELLNEVRTGEDFECGCHEHAGKIENFMEALKPKTAIVGSAAPNLIPAYLKGAHYTGYAS